MLITARLLTIALTVSLTFNVDGATPPVVRVAADAPITVAGSGFRKQEAVSVAILMGRHQLTAATITSADGEFTVRFAGTKLDRCATPLVVSARGDQTGVVTATLPMRECAAP